ncbi:hypothetical protein [Deinococcus ficus]|uniref:hypothetical protein n=1 Tax=Deinococcus ficus TaxID=317577 RepID=UPI00174B4D06|nr:hypothetical protein [Deinococcus ficus]
MTFTVSPAPPSRVLDVFAALYGTPAGDLGWLEAELRAAWVALDESGEALGALGARPSPAHGMELMGGSLDGEHGEAVAQALVEAARADLGRVYAFADGLMLPAGALSGAGLREVAAYRMLAGPTPTAAAPGPEGVTLRRLSDVPDLATRLDALGTYEDRIGHHAVAAAAAEEGAGGFDSTLSLIAVDAGGRAAGLCRAAREDGYLRIDAPGVRPDLRGSGLRAALLLGVCALAREAGFTDVSVESWGDTPEELAADLGLGLGVELENPIYAAGG